MPFDFNTLDHTYFMREALKEAELALQAGEAPIGAVIVHNGVIVGRGQAEHVRRQSRLAHAELNALLALADPNINPSAMLDMPHVRRHIHTYLGGILAEESEALLERGRTGL